MKIVTVSSENIRLFAPFVLICTDSIFVYGVLNFIYFVSQAQAALMYDSVKVVTESIAKIQKKLEGSDPRPGTFCDLNTPNLTFWQHGEKIARLMRKVSLYT